MTLIRNERVQRLLAISLAVTLDKIRGAAGSQTVEELLNIIHREAFCVDMFKETLK